jgi:hypothetical protein
MYNDKAVSASTAGVMADRANIGSAFDASTKPQANGVSTGNIRVNPLFKEVDQELRKLRTQFDLMKPESIKPTAQKFGGENLNSSVTSV